MKKFILFLIMQCFIATDLFSVMLDDQPFELPLPQDDYSSPQPEQAQPQDDTNPILQLAIHLYSTLSPDDFALLCNQLAHYIANHQPHTDLDTASSNLLLSPDIWPSEQALFDPVSSRFYLIEDQENPQQNDAFNAIKNHYTYSDLCLLCFYLTQDQNTPQQDNPFQDDGQDCSDDLTNKNFFSLPVTTYDTTGLLNSSRTPSPLPESPTLSPQTAPQQKKYQCPQCDHPPFADHSGLYKHIKAQHKGITYQCTLCDHPPFAGPSGLYYHVQAVHNGVTHQCPYCDHPPFATAANRKKHINAQHKGTIYKGTIYQCTHCTRPPFVSPSSLRYHVQTKHEGITYQCPQCNHKPFAGPSGLYDHINAKHKGTTYQCPHCDHPPFAGPSGLYDHIQTVHNGVTHQCPYCDHPPFTQKRSLNLHIKTKH